MMLTACGVSIIIGILAVLGLLKLAKREKPVTCLAIFGGLSVIFNQEGKIVTLSIGAFFLNCDHGNLSWDACF